jgi:hypothetical protein
MMQLALTPEQLARVVNNWPDFWRLCPMKAVKPVLNLRGTRDMADWLGVGEDSVRYWVSQGGMPGPDLIVGRVKVWGPHQAERARNWWRERTSEELRLRALSEQESEAVFRRWLGGERQVDLAAEYGVHQGTISRVCGNRRKGRLRRGPVPLL